MINCSGSKFKNFALRKTIKKMKRQAQTGRKYLHSMYMVKKQKTKYQKNSLHVG